MCYFLLFSGCCCRCKAEHPIKTSAWKADYSVSFFFFFRIGGTLHYLFWNAFGMTELEDLHTSERFVITQYAGELLLGLYTIASLLVAINMLIAMMSNTYQRVAVSTEESVFLSAVDRCFQDRELWQAWRLKQRERHLQI